MTAKQSFLKRRSFAQGKALLDPRTSQRGGCIATRSGSGGAAPGARASGIGAASAIRPTACCAG